MATTGVKFLLMILSHSRHNVHGSMQQVTIHVYDKIHTLDLYVIKLNVHWYPQVSLLQPFFDNNYLVASITPSDDTVTDSEKITGAALATTTLLDNNTIPLTTAISIAHVAVTNSALNNTEMSENAATSTEPISYAVGILAVLLLIMGTFMVVMLILYVHKEKQRNSETNNKFIIIIWTTVDNIHGYAWKVL